jgi:hypothetical protein
MGEELALKQIYGLLRPGDAPDTLTAKQALERCSSRRSATTSVASADTRSTSGSG